jgi:hypothetical protein
VAAKNGLTVVVQELLAKGASVLAVDENGELLDSTSSTYSTWLLFKTDIPILN